MNTASPRLHIVAVIFGLVGLVGLTGLVAGCGGSESASDKVKSTVTGFFGAVADNEGQRACAQLTGSAIQELNSAAFLLQAPASCPEAIETYNRQLSSDDKKALKSAEVNRVTVTRRTATVADNDIVLEIGGQAGLFRNNDPRPLALEKIGEDWKISSLG